MSYKIISESPVLPLQATDKERELADKYTYLISVPDADATDVWFKVDNQHFKINSIRFSIEEANWTCWMLAKAIENLTQKESKQKSK